MHSAVLYMQYMRYILHLKGHRLALAVDLASFCILSTVNMKAPLTFPMKASNDSILIDINFEDRGFS